MTQVWARAFRLDLAHSSSRSAPSSSPYKVSSHDVGGGNQHAQPYFFHRMHEKCILASETRLLKEIKFRFLTETEKVLRFSIVDNHVRKIISTPKKSQISFRAFFPRFVENSTKLLTPVFVRTRFRWLRYFGWREGDSAAATVRLGEKTFGCS